MTVEINWMIIMMIEVSRRGIIVMIKRIADDMINTIIHIIKVIRSEIDVIDENIEAIVMKENAAAVDFRHTRMADAVKMNMIMSVMSVEETEIQNITKKVNENTLIALHMVVARMQQHLVIIIHRHLKAAHRHPIISINRRYRESGAEFTVSESMY